MSNTVSRALLAVLIATPAAPTIAQAPAGPPISAPDIVYRERTLANGMRVFAVRDASTPNVAVQVFYGVGAKDDPQGRSGFAHLFEHLMFKRTRNMRDEMMDRLTEDVGGYNNATTGDDFTNYYEVVPANHLQRILWAEAERLGSLVVDEKNFASERDVVKEELRQRVFANPYGRFLRYLIPQSSFTVHPYRRSGIGSIEDLDAATLEDVRSFHQTYYRPDNAALIVAGNFEPAQLDRWVDQYFAPLARPAEPLPRVTVEEPARTGPRTVTGYGPNVPLPAVAITWQAPAARHPDAAPLAVLDAVLSAGESSRLYESLVYRQQLAQNAFSSSDTRAHPGLFMTGAILASGKTVEQGETALMAEVARVRDALVTPEELAEAKTEFTASALRGRETNEGKSYAIGAALTVEGDPARVNTGLKEIAAVSAADVQRVARQYLDPERRVVIRYLPESARPAAEAAAPAQATTEAPAAPSAAPIAAAPTPAAAPPAQPTPSPPSQAVQPPPVGPAVRVSVPTPAERTLPNGMRVIVATDRDSPLVTARVLIRSGAEVDPPRLAGASSMTATLLTKGAGARSATEIAQAVERLGASLAAGAGWDGVYVDLDALAPNLEPAAAILADVVRRPRFEQAELDRERQQALDGLQVSLKQPGSVASLVVNPLVFTGDAYGHPAGGTPESLARITRADIQTLHGTWYRPDNATLILAGDITPEAGFALAQRLFGDWNRPRTRLLAIPIMATRSQGAGAAPRVVVIDMPESGQAAVYFARRGVRRSDRAYTVAEVTDSVLGGGYSARLNQEVRIRRGLSYGARSFVDARRRGGLLGAVIQTKNESADEVVEVLLGELDRLRTQPVGAAELTPRKAVLVGGFGRELETGGGLAGLISDLALHGRPLSELNRYLGQVEAVTPEQIATYARSGLAADGGATVIVVGDAKAFVADLRRKFPRTELIPAAELKLDSATLR